MAESKIEWCSHVWNSFTGCDSVSPGCANCYARPTAESLQRRERGRIAKARREGKPDPKTRYQNDGDSKTSGPGFGFTVHWDKLEKPERFPAGARVFVNSMSDVFHEEAPIEAVTAMWRVFAEQPAVDFLVLTKRPEQMQGMVNSIPVEFERLTGQMLPSWPLPNVWLGVSIENRKFVGRADLLRQTPAAIRFVSAEPLLGPLVAPMSQGSEPLWNAGKRGPEIDLTGINWLIVGGESAGPAHRRLVDDFGPTARAQQWVRHLRDAARAEGTAFFLKQWGGNKPTSFGRLLDGRTWDEMPR